MTAAPQTTPLPFIDLLRARAARERRRIVFPESADLRVRTAVEFLARERIVEPILVLDPAAPETHAAVHALGVETIDPGSDARMSRTAADIFAAYAEIPTSEAVYRETIAGIRFDGMQYRTDIGHRAVTRR